MIHRPTSASPSRQDDSLSSRWRRSARWRSPLIAVLSLAVLVGAAVTTWDVDPAELWGYLGISVIGVVFLIGLAFLFSLVLRWLRRK